MPLVIALKFVWIEYCKNLTEMPADFSLFCHGSRTQVGFTGSSRGRVVAAEESKGEREREEENKDKKGMKEIGQSKWTPLDGVRFHASVSRSATSGGTARVRRARARAVWMRRLVRCRVFVESASRSCAPPRYQDRGRRRRRRPRGRSLVPARCAVG